MLMFDTVVQTQFGSFFKAFALSTDAKPTTGVCPGSKIEEFNPATGVVDTYRWNGEAWAKIDANGTPVVPSELPAIQAGDGGKVLTADEANGYKLAPIPDELPPLPEEAGTYTLQLVIASGADPVLTWEAAEETVEASAGGGE